MTPEEAERLGQLLFRWAVVTGGLTTGVILLFHYRTILAVPMIVVTYLYLQAEYVNDSHTD